MKGLHKNSLRKVDNPHQWMIDDARMELIQQIKAEVERRRDLHYKYYVKHGRGSSAESRYDEDVELLSFLDTLQEQPLLPGFENEQPGIPGKDFVPVAWCDALEQYGIWRIERVEQPVCEGLEEETEKFIETFGWGKTKHLAEKELVSATARHFAKWGAEHLKK